MKQYAVIYTPWEGQPRIHTLHKSAARTLKIAQIERDAFAKANPGSYGPTWKPAQSDNGRSWEVLSDDPEADYSDFGPDLSPEIIELP